MRVDTAGYLRFGKHNGDCVSSAAVPLEYLEWCVENVHFTASEFNIVQGEIYRRYEARDSAKQQSRASDYGFRSGRQQQQQSSSSRYAPPPPPAPKNKEKVSTETLLRVISAGRKSLAARCHPDAGGDPAEMVLINNAADYLETFAKGLTASR
jgi:hypothetical protein